MLEHLGIRSVRLLTNNPDKVKKLRALGVSVVGTVPVVVPPNPFSAGVPRGQARPDGARSPRVRRAVVPVPRATQRRERGRRVDAAWRWSGRRRPYLDAVGDGPAGTVRTVTLPGGGQAGSGRTHGPDGDGQAGSGRPRGPDGDGESASVRRRSDDRRATFFSMPSAVTPRRECAKRSSHAHRGHAQPPRHRLRWKKPSSTRPETIDAIERALGKAGHSVEPIDVTGPASLLVTRLEAFAPDIVFNLAEGQPRQDATRLLPGALRGARHPFDRAATRTRSCVTLDKALTKKQLAGWGVPSPRGRFVTREIAARRAGSTSCPSPSS